MTLDELEMELDEARREREREKRHVETLTALAEDTGGVTEDMIDAAFRLFRGYLGAYHRATGDQVVVVAVSAITTPDEKGTLWHWTTQLPREDMVRFLDDAALFARDMVDEQGDDQEAEYLQ